MDYKRLNEIDKCIDDIKSFLDFLKYRGLGHLRFTRRSRLGEIDFDVKQQRADWKVQRPGNFFRRTDVIKNVFIKTVTDTLLSQLKGLQEEKKRILNKRRWQFRL